MDLFQPWDSYEVGANVNAVLIPVILETPQGHLFRVVGTKQYVYLQGSVTEQGPATFLHLVILKTGIIPTLGIQQGTKQYSQGPTSYNNVFKCLDLCSGAGFMSVGAKVAGFQDVGGMDQNIAFKPLYEQIHDGPFWHFNIGDESAIEHCLNSGLMGSTILSGINCQPYSRAGDQRGFLDPRAMSLPYTLRLAWYLQSPCICLECTPSAASDAQVQQMIREYCEMAGFVPTQSILHLDRCWAGRRDRWWCVLMPSILGPWTLPDLPIMPRSQKIHQIMPYVKKWLPTEMEELSLTPYEYEKFLEFAGPIENLLMDDSKAMPTALHAWGNQLYRCRCGCRQAFSDHRLRTKGLHAMLIGTGGTFQHDHRDIPFCRHPHPNEVLLLSGMYPNMDFQGQMRLGLAAAGQLASPIQSAWVMSHVRQHIDKFMQIQPCTEPALVLEQFQASLLRARDIAWPPLSVAHDPMHSSVPSSHPDQMQVDITVEGTQGPIVQTVAVSQGATVEDMLAAECALQIAPKTSVQIVSHDFSQPLALHHVFQHGERVHVVSTDPYASVNDRHVAHDGTRPMDFVPFTEEDFPMEPMDSTVRGSGSLDLPLDLADPPLAGSVPPHEVPTRTKPTEDPLCRLPATALMQLVAPQVASQNTLDSLLSQTLNDYDRYHILDIQQDLCADDEMRFHLRQLCHDAPSDQAVSFWDPLAITSLWACQHEHLIKQWCVKLPATATVITAVWIEAHWVPIVWRKDQDQLYGYTFGNQPQHEAAMTALHTTVGALCQCPTHPMRNEKASVPKFCGAASVAFIRHLVMGTPLPSDRDLASLHDSLRQQFQFEMQTVTPRPWIWGRGSENHDATLIELLRKHGVASDDVQGRADHIKTTLGSTKVLQAMGSQNPWKDLKWLANQMIPPYQLIRPRELEQAIAARSRDGNAVGTRRMKQKGAGKGKKPAVSKQQLDPATLRVSEGTFYAGDAPLPQISIGDIGPLASGIVLATADQAHPFLGRSHPISMGGLAIVVIGDTEVGDQIAQLPTVVRFPATCVANNEPILVDGRVFQMGSTEVVRSRPKQPVGITTIDTFVAKICVHRDLFLGDWDHFQTQPLKYVISQLPMLQVCGEQGCTGCGKWHSTEQARDSILAVWNRQWLTNAYTPCKPDVADMYVVTIRVPSSLEQSLLQTSGAAAISTEPRELDGRMISKSYYVSWLPRMNYAQAMALKQTTPGAIGLARLGTKWGIRCRIGDAARVYETLKPDSQYLPSGQQQRYLMGPLPYGTLKPSVSELRKQIGWPCRPVQPAPAARSVEGIMWKIQSTSPPPTHHVQTEFGDVVITRIDTPKQDEQQAPAAIASTATLKLCSQQDSGAIDPLQANDPWAKHLGARVSDTSALQQPSAPSALAFEQQVVDHVLAKLPKAPMDTDIPEQHNSRLSALESQVQLLTEQQASIHLSVQEHGLAQQAQISQLQHQFQAQHATLEHAVADQQRQVQGLTTQFQQQLDKQKQQIDSMFSQQMSRMEDLLGAKKQRFE